MSRLPELERALLDAATRLQSPATDAPEAAPDRRHARRWRRRSAPLLAGLACLIVAGAAVAAATGLLTRGDPVPPTRGSPLRPAPGVHGFVLAGVRASDPGGGPQWAIGTYEALPDKWSSHARDIPADITAELRSPVTCIVVGRTQNGQLGVVGRDGVFGNDGRFHPLSPAAQSGYACGGRGKDGVFVSFSLGPPIPASGYTGPSGTAIGGCRERANLNGPTVSPQTRRKLRGVAQCDPADLRDIVAGFAGPHAATATLDGPGYHRTLILQRRDNGAFLSVVRPTSAKRPRLTITDHDGNACEPFSPIAPTTAAAQHPQAVREPCSDLL